MPLCVTIPSESGDIYIFIIIKQMKGLRFHLYCCIFSCFFLNNSVIKPRRDLRIQQTDVYAIWVYKENVTDVSFMNLVFFYDSLIP